MSAAPFPSSEDNEVTDPEKLIHEPIGRIARRANRLIRLVLVFCGLILLGNLFVIYWLTFAMKGYRASTVERQNQILESLHRIRAAEDR